jgi:hypothetical protein
MMKRIGSLLSVRSSSGRAGRRFTFLLLVFWLGFVVRPSAYGIIVNVQHLPANQYLLDDNEVPPEEPQREDDAGALLVRRDDDDETLVSGGCWRKSRK